MRTIFGLLTIFALGSLQPAFALDESDFASAMLSVTPLRTAYAESVSNRYSGDSPSSLAELGEDETYYQSSLVEHVDIDPVSGAIMIGLSPDFGQNEWVAWIPIISNYYVQQWVCQSTVSKDIAGTLGCASELSYDAITQVIGPDLFVNTIIQTTWIRLGATESYQINGSFPRSMDELGVTDDWLEAANVSNVIVMPYFNTILFALQDIYGANQWLALRAKVVGGAIDSFTCKTTLPSSLATDPNCTTSVAIEDIIW